MCVLSYNGDRGVMGVEWIVVLLIWGMVLGSVLPIVYHIDRLRLSTTVFLVYQFIDFGRYKALSHGSPVDYKVIGDQLIMTQFPIEKLRLSKCRVVMNRSLGFTPRGTTKSSGTIRVLFGDREGRISIGVGYSRVSRWMP